MSEGYFMDGFQMRYRNASKQQLRVFRACPACMDLAFRERNPAQRQLLPATSFLCFYGSRRVEDEMAKQDTRFPARGAGVDVYYERMLMAYVWQKTT